MAKYTPTQTNDNAGVEEVGGKTVVTHDNFLDAKIDDAVSAKIKMMNLNTVSLGCSILEKKVGKGKAKKDAQGNETGDFWPDSYSVEISFEGGKFGVRVDEPTFHLLQTDGTRYIAKGILESKVNEYGFHQPNAKITSFERLF